MKKIQAAFPVDILDLVLDVEGQTQATLATSMAFEATAAESAGRWIFMADQSSGHARHCATRNRQSNWNGRWNRSHRFQ